MQFERPHHQRIAHVLSALNGETLVQHGCLFGGGTCIALRYGEYRESEISIFWCLTGWATESCAIC